MLFVYLFLSLLLSICGEWLVWIWRPWTASLEQANADELAYKVGLAVYDKAGGVGDRPAAPWCCPSLVFQKFMQLLMCQWKVAGAIALLVKCCCDCCFVGQMLRLLLIVYNWVNKQSESETVAAVVALWNVAVVVALLVTWWIKNLNLKMLQSLLLYQSKLFINGLLHRLLLYQFVSESCKGDFISELLLKLLFMIVSESCKGEFMSELLLKLLFMITMLPKLLFYKCNVPKVVTYMQVSALWMKCCWFCFWLNVAEIVVL